MRTEREVQTVPTAWCCHATTGNASGGHDGGRGGVYNLSVALGGVRMPLRPSSWRGWMSEVSAYSPASTLKPTFASIWPGIEFSAPAICDLRTKRSRSRTSSQGCDHAIRSSVGPRARGSRHSGQPRRTCDSGLLKPSHRPRACSAIHTLTSPPLRQGLLSRGRHLRETSAVENRPDVRESRGTARNRCRRRSKAAGTGPGRLPDRQPLSMASSVHS